MTQKLYVFYSDNLWFDPRDYCTVDQVEACNARLRIPVRPEVRSLNLATSAALALGEALRQTASLPA